VDVVVQFPSWRDVATRLKRARIVYDCIDDHARLPHVTTPLEGDERALAQEAELSLATSEALERRLTMLGARNVLRSPNAGVAPNPDAWPHYRDAAIVYLGAIEEWFDFTLLEAAAQAVREAEVRVIGACNVALPRGLSRRIRFMGEMDHASAMRALSHARVGIIPFRRSALIDAVDPVKAYEYLGAGLPVVMTPMGAGHLSDVPGVSVAHHAASFRAAVARAYGETQPTDRDAFAAWAQRETWDARAAAIVARLRD
jgi:glycosyltransferase involved in cell wall biosynthesis